jgi:transcriptional regulator with XRE-family HTH domain
MSFGAVLKRIRRDKGKTQREVAAAIGMDYTYFSRLENDRFDSKPTRETVLKIADALGCTPDEKSELLAAAGRIDEEMERIARTAGERPELKQLFRKMAKLTPDEAREVDEFLKKRLGRRNAKT